MDMKSKGRIFFRASAVILTLAVLIAAVKLFHKQILGFAVDVMVLSAKSYLVTVRDTRESYESLPETTSVQQTVTEKTTEEDIPAVKVTEATTEKTTEKKTDVYSISLSDEDVAAIMKSAEKKAEKDKKDGAISDYRYTKDGATDIYGSIRVKNTNKTKINIESELKKKADLKVSEDEPSVLIYHTHTTETYQLIDRDFYAQGNKTRSNKEDRNMIRVGKAIKEQLEKAGYKVIHVTDIHDNPYSGAYSRSRENISSYLKKYPSIDITLDIHRDAIQRSDGTKIAPTVEINGRKAAQIMIISGCQEDGNGITNLPDWKYNLTFALQLQQSLESSFPGLTRPVFFCARSYNMNLTHNSLLVEVGSDANTLDEAVYSGKCLGVALARLMKEYEK